MIDYVKELLEYQFMINALLAALLVGIACGIAGTYMVVRRMVFMGGGVTHSSFGGVGMAYYLGLNPVWGALVFGVMSALAIERISEKSKISEDSAIGILWSIGMALGVIFVVITPGYAPNLMSFLFGNILLVSSLDLVLLLCLDVALVGGMLIFYRSIIYTALDKEFAQIQGIAVRLVSYMMMLALALTIVFAIKAVGIMLLMSLLTIPAVVGGLLAQSYSRITLWACGVSFLGLLGGISLSYIYNIPAGAASVILLGALFLIVKSVTWFFRRRRTE